jgi:glutathione S-transferase
MMKLYYHPVSTTSRPVALFAADHQIELDYQLVDLLQGEHVQPAFTAINANQAVPMLEDGEFRLTESSAILKYLADCVGSQTYPFDLRQRARINERMDWINTSLSRELGYGFVYPQIMPAHKRPDEHSHRQTIAWGRERALRWLKVLDESILGASNRYLCGNELTIADYLGIAHVTLGETVRIDFAKWPNVARWIARLKDRQHWASVNDPFYRYLVQPFAKVSFEVL